ncbi:MAG: YlxR family protein [Clostridia bacterium]|nr:YlxR family protein [Clostridia bacterium]MBR0407067.1 YlxR family protein [Clostridia bacterium]
MKEKKVPMRMCVGCREMKPKKELLRVVRSPEGEVSIDVTGRKPGRGAYVCHSADCLKRAIKQKQLERAFECALGEETHASLLAELEKLEAQA